MYRNCGRNGPICVMETNLKCGIASVRLTASSDSDLSNRRPLMRLNGHSRTAMRSVSVLGCGQNVRWDVRYDVVKLVWECLHLTSSKGEQGWSKRQALGFGIPRPGFFLFLSFLTIPVLASQVFLGQNHESYLKNCPHSETVCSVLCVCDCFGSCPSIPPCDFVGSRNLS